MSAIADLDPRHDMRLIRERLAHQLAAGKDVEPILRDLAQRNCLALADVVVGPHAPVDPVLIRAALGVVEGLESAVAPNGLYRRLIALAGPAAIEVLQVAANRHPAASWQIALCHRVEENAPGRTHLLAAAGHPAFTAACWSHAEAGHHAGLIATGAQTGLPEPCGALAAVGAVDAAAEAAVRALERTPDSPVVAIIAAAWGPDPSTILQRTVAHLRSRATAEALRSQCVGYPAIAALLETICRAMVRDR